MPKHKHHPGLPRGATWADKLARDRAIKEALRESAKDTTIQVQVDIRCQRQLWLCAVALSEGFGFGKDRIMKFFQVLQKCAEDFDQMREENDEEFANEKLRQRAEQISGMKIEYLYEQDMIAARKKHEAEGIDLSEIIP